MPDGFLSFSLSQVTQLSVNSILVSYTKYPLTTNPNYINDALNHQNYSITGLGVVFINHVEVVNGDPTSVRLILREPIPNGTWTLTVSNVARYDGEVLLKNKLTFITNDSAPDIFSENLTPEDTLRKNFNPAFRNKTKWKAIVTALSTGDKNNVENAIKANKQLYKSTASGFYLDRKCGDDGITRPSNIGLPDELFRLLGIRLTNTKLTLESILEVLEIFYGTDSVRAHAITSVPEPFSLIDGDELRMVIDEKEEFHVTFSQSSFRQINSASAIEVAFALNEFFKLNRSKAFAVSVYDPLVQKNRLYIYSGSLGLVSSVRIIGGRSQNVFLFPFRIPAYNPLVGVLPTWNITKNTATEIVRFTVTGPTGLDLLSVAEGDYVTIYGNEFFPENRGTFFVQNVSVTYPGGILTQYFEVYNPNGIPQLGVMQLADSSLYYFTPEKQTIQKQIQRTVVVAQDEKGLHIQLPATTQAVGRTVYTGAYLNTNPPLIVEALLRTQDGVVKVTAPNHNLSVGDVIFVEDVIGINSPPLVIAGDLIGPPLKTDASLGSIWSPLKATTQTGTYNHTATLLLDGRVLLAGGYDSVGAIYRNVTELFAITATNTLFNGELQYEYEWQPSASFTTGVAGHQATLFQKPIKNGEVLLSGGYDGVGYQTSAYVYTPDTGMGTWSTIASLNVARYLHTQIELDNNKMMVCGGQNPTPLNSIELYDPTLDTWTLGGPMYTPRYQHGMTKLLDGRILVAGGFNTTATHLCEIYDPNTNTWTKTGSMTFARYKHTLITLPTGEVIAVGGSGFNPTQSTTISPLKECEMYNPTTQMWDPIGVMSTERDYPAVGYIPSLKKIYITGGSAITTDYFDVIKKVWDLSPAKITATRLYSLATVMNVGTVLLSGGINAGDSSKDNFLLIPAADRFLSGGLHGVFTVTSIIDADHFTYFTPNYQDYTASIHFTITPFKARPAITPGPYIFDPKEGLAITGIETTLTQDLFAGRQYNTLLVTSSLDFPDENGWIVVGFAGDNVAAPIRYYGKISATEIAIDHNYVFQKNILSGAKVTILYKKGIWVPEHPESVGSFYLTDSPSGRIAASNTIDFMVAAGIDVFKKIVYPGDYGLGGYGLPAQGTLKLSDKVIVWGGSDIDAELNYLRQLPLE
jgi:hypothetical protein